jgi:membrane protein
VAFFALLAVFPGIAAIVSLYGLFADASTIGKHLSVLSGFLPDGVLALIAEQITVISRQGNETIGAAFVVGLLIALGSANSGMAALFDALNVVYDEREKRSLVRFYATTLLFTLAGIVFVILAIMGVVVLPLMLRFVGLATTTEWLIAILRWPVLLVTIVVSLACIYRYGPSRRDAAGAGSPGAASSALRCGWWPRCCSPFTSLPSTATTRHTARWVPASASWSGCGSRR